ncbi:hypothetical protein J4474_00195 [Candidatus Pacearchaeota archaeon]|nr:hypothetical protein [Candidatus Pacearchaeota archaeon]
MGLIDQIIQLRAQGYPDDQIIDALKQQGINPREISDAIAQAQIKNAVAGEQEMSAEEYQNVQNNYSDQQTMQAPQPTQQNYPEQQQQYYGENQYGQQGGTQNGGYYEQQNYSSGQNNSETTMEIAEQVFDEKIKKFEKQISESSEFKNTAQSKIDQISERLKRIENMIDQLQVKILDKVSSYNDSLSSIKGEMSMMEDSFQKMINPVLDKHTEHGKSSHEKAEEHHHEPISSKVDEILKKHTTHHKK